MSVIVDIYLRIDEESPCRYFRYSDNSRCERDEMQGREFALKDYGHAQ